MRFALRNTDFAHGEMKVSTCVDETNERSSNTGGGEGHKRLCNTQNV